MDVREKLVELLKTNACPSPFMCDPACRYYGLGDCFTYRFADYLIAHGVTVQDGKPLDAFLHPVDAYKGLKAKYLVFKADTGERVGNCFVLRPEKDPASVEALRAYASVTDNETLAKDIYNWVGKGVTVQEWINADERVPDEPMRCLVYTKRGKYWGYEITYYNQGFYTQYAEAIYWMPLPQAPKGE